MKEYQKNSHNFDERTNINNYNSSSIKTTSIQNYFRGDYFQNKNEKDKAFFSPRTKENEINKSKPRLLTGRLPAAFNVKGEMYIFDLNFQK